MKWQTALDFAKNAPDLTYEEWCGLYVPHELPGRIQIQKALDVAHPILVRNNIIHETVVLRP